MLYTLGAVTASLVLAVVLGPMAFAAIETLFWFFTYRFTLTPFLIITPVFILLGLGIPLLTYRSAARHTIVERLREE